MTDLPSCWACSASYTATVSPGHAQGCTVHRSGAASCSVCCGAGVVIHHLQRPPPACVLYPRALPAVRQDPNPQLKQGVVGAFVITRALAMLQASEDCSALPLSCGAPLGSASCPPLFPSHCTSPGQTPWSKDYVVHPPAVLNACLPGFLECMVAGRVRHIMLGLVA